MASCLLCLEQTAHTRELEDTIVMGKDKLQ